jgi:(3,5-dihydroxyphenyl)acetyl-CoA 1,2-dioxygenase
MLQAQGKRSSLETLQRAGLNADAIIAWPQHKPARAGAFAADLQAYSAYWQASITSLQALPLKAKRSPLEHEAAQHILYSACVSRDEFLAVHAAAVYDRLTDQRSRFVRVEELASNAATMFPGLVPSKQTLAQEHEQLQKDKDGHEIDCCRCRSLRLIWRSSRAMAKLTLAQPTLNGAAVPPSLICVTPST